MASFSNFGSLTTLQWVLAQGTPAPPTTGLWVKLHIGDPGPDGLSNPAANTERMLLPIGPAQNIDTDGRAQAATDDNVSWPSVPATEIYSHVTIWDDETAGNCWYYDSMLSAVEVTAGAAFVFPVGQLIDHV